jgi:hypothetical protein
MSRLFSHTLFLLVISTGPIAGCKKGFTDLFQENSLQREQVNGSFSSLDMPEYLTEQYTLPIRVDSDFKWGISGHPLTQEPYLNNHALQADLIKELNAPYYRIDIPHNENGEVNDLYRFNSIITQTAAKNIEIVPVIFPPDTSTLFAYTISEAATKGYLLGKGFASRYKQYFNYYQLGNEEDGKLLPTVSPGSGSQISDYKRTERIPIWVIYLNGMIAGINEEDPTAKTIVNNGGWYHYGYFLLLDSLHVNYDILGYNWYTGIPDYLNVLNVLQTTFASKEVWFTELNVQDSTILVTPALHRKRIEDLISNLDRRSNIKAVFIYELFDEDQHFDPDEANIEDIFGLIDWTVPYVYTNFTYKEGYKTYKFKIEETKHGFEDLIYSLYTYANHRAPDPGGLTYWTNRIASSRDVPAIINEFLGAEFYGAFVEEQYQSLYGRAADPTGKSYWTNRLMTDMSRENVITTFCSDTEFWTLSGSTNSGFIDRAYQKLFNRVPTTTDNAYWTQRLTTGTSRMTMIEEMLHNDEYLHIFVRAQYNFLLRRNGNVDPISENWAVGLMQNGMTQRGIIKTFMNSKEFWERGVQEGYVRNNPPYQF